jgi:hypothetical protein
MAKSQGAVSGGTSKIFVYYGKNCLKLKALPQQMAQTFSKQYGFIHPVRKVFLFFAKIFVHHYFLSLDNRHN